jgi:hypothetical protein
MKKRFGTLEGSHVKNGDLVQIIKIRVQLNQAEISFLEGRNEGGEEEPLVGARPPGKGARSNLRGPS